MLAPIIPPPMMATSAVRMNSVQDEGSKGHPVGVVVRLRNCTSEVCDECQAAWCELKSVAQPGSTAKAAYSLARSCPIKEAWLRYWRLCGWWRRGSEKNNARPRWRDCVRVADRA